MDAIQGAGRATAFSSTAIREAAYIRIREEIRSWNRYHDELSLISRLPPELLVAVFKYNVEVDSNLDWIRVSHVCTHWRRVALECASLWTNIPFHRPKWAKEMLARSKMAPLIIMLVFVKSWRMRKLLCVPCTEASVVKATISQLSRINKLALDQGKLGKESFIELVSLLDSPAPLLETLEISFSGFAAENRLPDKLLSGQAPRLTHLHVEAGILNWRALPFTNLESLEVRSAIGPPLEHIIFALLNLPCLESFICGTSYTWADVTSTPCTIIVDLPRLANLEIGSGLPTCVFLLDHITYPETTQVIVRCSVVVMKEHHIVNVPSAQRLANDLIRRAQKPIYSLVVQRREVIVETFHSTIRHAVHKRRCQLLLHLSFVSSGHSVSDIVADTIQALPTLGHTEMLVVERISLPKATWINHFRGLTRLKELQIGSDCAGFLKVFSDSSLATPGQFDHAAHFAFEALRELTISHWIFDEDCNYPEDGLGKSCVASLIAGLKARQEAGLALEKLVLNNCRHVERSSAAALSKFVMNVVCDGDPRFTTYYEDDDDE
ncbi:hypothetical protein FPV67DRAFT_1588831 [Lyophyllum atratum]|nr:hypothetical protein FPV67DRAFT_1588831 [Lyophyllum atratum]